MGLRIQKFSSIVGFDNMVGVADLFLPPLSTIRLPHREMGRAAALHIIRRRKGTGIYQIASQFIRESFLLGRLYHGSPTVTRDPLEMRAW